MAPAESQTHKGKSQIRPQARQSACCHTMFLPLGSAPPVPLPSPLPFSSLKGLRAVGCACPGPLGHPLLGPCFRIATPFPFFSRGDGQGRGTGIMVSTKFQPLFVLLTTENLSLGLVVPPNPALVVKRPTHKSARGHTGTTSLAQKERKQGK